jgi:Outer membrane protein beta-barrel domain
MKKLAVTVIVCAAVLLAAPRPSSAARVEAGLKLGVNFAWLHGADTKVWPDMAAGWVMRFGLCGGGFVALPVSKTVAIQAEALVTTKGSKEVGALFEEPYNYSLMITYLEVPVLVRFTILRPNRSARLVFLTGPAFAFKLHSRFTLAGEHLDFNGVRPNDLGLVFSVGYVIRSQGYTEFRYTAGLNNIIEEGGGPLNIKNGVFSVIAGYRF